MTSKRLDVAGDPDHDADAGIFKGIFCHCRIGQLYEICRQLKKLSTNSYDFQGWHVSLVDVFILTRVSIRVSDCMCVRTAVFHRLFVS